MYRFLFTILLIATAACRFVLGFSLGAADYQNPGLEVIAQSWFLNAPTQSNRTFGSDASFENPHNSPRKNDACSQDDCKQEMYSDKWPMAYISEMSGPIPSQEFIYNARVTNNGQRLVSAIRWDYVFSDPITGSELARHKFYTKIKLASGKSRTLTELSTKPPTFDVTVNMLLRANEYNERIEIKAIEYADGLNWIANASGSQ